jgi:stearoyl-CoA desaturase (delta-9 desaturase)
MSKRWERVFHFLTWFVQGSSYLNPRAYAIMHRMHHAFSDTPSDPHSPMQQPNFFKMMWRTKTVYDDLRLGRVPVDPRFDGGVPHSRLFDEKLSSMPVMLGWMALYTGIYAAFATHWAVFLLLPIHWALGPVHGAIVNWAGHKIGYRNYESDDHSRNTLVFDVLTMGELFQNNHHKWGQSPNFGVRAFEIDPAYQIMRVLSWLGVIDMSGSQRPRWERARPKAAGLALPAPAPMDGE